MKQDIDLQNAFRLNAALEIVEHISDLNEPITRIGGGTESVWQRFISSLSIEPDFLSYYWFVSGKTLQLVQVMLEREADLDATVDAWDPTNAGEIRQCPAKFAFELGTGVFGDYIDSKLPGVVEETADFHKKV